MRELILFANQGCYPLVNKPHLNSNYIRMGDILQKICPDIKSYEPTNVDLPRSSWRNQIAFNHGAFGTWGGNVSNWYRGGRIIL